MNYKHHVLFIARQTSFSQKIDKENCSFTLINFVHKSWAVCFLACMHIEFLKLILHVFGHGYMIAVIKQMMPVNKEKSSQLFKKSRLTYNRIGFLQTIKEPSHTQHILFKTLSCMTETAE